LIEEKKVSRQDAKIAKKKKEEDQRMTRMDANEELSNFSVYSFNSRNSLTLCFLLTE